MVSLVDDFAIDFDVADLLGDVPITHTAIIPDREWMESHLWIRTKAGTIEPFRLNPIQVKLLEAIHKLVAEGKPIRVLILKARQMGSSTFCEALGYAITRLNPHHNAGIIGNETENSNHLFGMYELYHKKDEGAPPTQRHNRKALLYEEGHGSQVIVTTAQKPNAATGHTNQFVHCSEVAKWRDADTTMDSLLPTIPKFNDNPFAIAIQETTAFGASGYFYNLWREAIKGMNDWLPLFFAWFEDPRYRMKVGSTPLTDFGTNPRYNSPVRGVTKDGQEIRGEEDVLREDFGCDDEQLTWRRWTIDNDSRGDIDKFHQEYPATWREAFLASGRPRYSIPILTQWEDRAKPPIWTGDINPAKAWVEGDENAFIRVWRWPEADETYVIGADCAEGNQDGDYSSASVLSRTGREVVATIHGHLGEFESDAYGFRLQQVGFRFNRALIAAEINAYGLAVVEWLLKARYPHLYYHTTKGEKKKKPQNKAGWRTQTGTKELMVSDLAAAIRDETITVHDALLIEELIGYMILENGSTGCDDSDPLAFDDRHDGLAIALQALAFDMDSIYPGWDEDSIRKRKRRRAA